MKEYTVVYKGTRKSEMIMVPDKKTLIQEMYNGDVRKFKEEVQSLQWSTTSMHYVEDVQSEKIHAEITSADVNPYGWRNA